LTKIVDDTERRLNILFDGLNNETVPATALGQMKNITNGEFSYTCESWYGLMQGLAMAARDANGALAMHVELLTNATGEMTAWAVSDLDG
jgi:protein transport protein SEC31